MANKKITELPILTTPQLSGVTVVVQDGITYESALGSIVTLFTGITGNGTSGTSGTSGADGSLNALPYSAVEDRKDYTGFLNTSDIHVSYDWTGRTITLTGTTLEYYWRGVKHTLTSPWTSPVHVPINSSWFLYSTDGTTFNWSSTAWAFTDLMVAAVYYRLTQENTFGIRETHGLMDAESHEEFHRNTGTYLISGCNADTNSYSGNTPTDDANSPSFFSGVLMDEDLRTSIDQWNENSYTLMYVAATGTTANRNKFILNSPLPFSGTTNTYIRVNNPITGGFAEGRDNKYYNIYQVLLPVTADPISQNFRMIFLQPQVEYTSLAAARAENPKSLSTSTLSRLSAEYLIYTRITYHTSSGYTNSGKCVIPSDGVSYVTGSRESLYLPTGSTITITDGGEYRVLTSDAGGENIIGNQNLMFDGSRLSVSGDTNISGLYMINGVPISTGSSGTSGTSGNVNGSLNIVIDGGGSPIPLGISMDVEWRFGANITGWSIMADQTGSTVIDIWETSFASFPPTVANSVCGSEKPTLSNQLTNQDLSLTTWTSSLAAGDIWRINVDSANTVTRVTVSFHYTRTS